MRLVEVFEDNANKGGARVEHTLDLAPPLIRQKRLEEGEQFGVWERFLHPVSQPSTDRRAKVKNEAALSFEGIPVDLQQGELVRGPGFTFGEREGFPGPLRMQEMVVKEFHQRRRRSFLIGLIAVLAGGLGRAAAPAEIFPLEDVRAGQTGVWRTVVAGTEIREFELRILGVVEHFAGPRQPVIIAEALDAENILSGPVAGMSGSPVYIDGRILGAYAYGYQWPKEQAIIGITPIEQMLEILEFSQEEGSVTARTGRREAPRFARSERANAPGLPQLQPVPTPLMLGGFSERTIGPFREELETLGFAPSAAPAGAGDDISLILQPGAPVAGVLMTGDFQAAATGTITWTDGERLLAFGHPFLQAGAIDMPLAGADIITIVRGLQSSFKLANIGPPEGRLFQDRLTGIAGTRGEPPPMTRLRLRMTPAQGESIEYAADLWPHPRFVPLLAAMSVLQSADQTLHREDEQTFQLDGTVTLANGEVLQISRQKTGPGASLGIAYDVLFSLQDLMDNPFEPLEITDLDLQVNARLGFAAKSLRQVQLGDASPRAGSSLPLILRLHGYRGLEETVALEVPLPGDLRAGQTIELTVTDAAGANALIGAGRRTADSVGDVLERWHENRPEGFAYVFLTTGHSLPEMSGQRLPELPPSIRASLGSRETDFVVASGGKHIRWETRVPIDGVFSGNHTISLILQ